MKNILIISPESWGINRLSKHHYAQFLSEKNNVYFLNPPIGYSKIPFGDMQIDVIKIDQTLTQVTYKNCIPKINSWPKFLRNYFYKIQAKRILKKIDLSIDIVWAFDPRRFTKINIWNAKQSIYHSVDLHPNSFESEISKEADLCVGISDIICDDLKNNNSRVIKIGHGSHIDTSDQTKMELPGSNKIKAIYTGNFHKHIDYHLMLDLINRNSDVDFIMIGPTESSNISADSISNEVLNQLKKQSHVYFIGSIDGNQLSQYLNSADINLVLFKKEYELIHHNPHKLMGYFASGKVVLSNLILEYKNAPNWLIEQCNQEDLIERFLQIKQNISTINSSENQLKRKCFADENHYRNKIELILNELNQ